MTVQTLPRRVKAIVPYSSRPHTVRRPSSGPTPIQWQQVVEPLNRMLGNAGQNIGQPGLRIDVIHLGRLCRRDRSRRTATTCVPRLLPVHSAHAGQELEVYYRYHPYFGRKVLVRRIEQRATGQFLSAQGPAGIVVSIAGWMLDPVICAGMTIGAPRVDLAALVELERLLIGTANPAHSRNDVAIVREEGNEISEIAGGGADVLARRFARRWKE
jgi:hypothetical protein